MPESTLFSQLAKKSKLVRKNVFQIHHAARPQHVSTDQVILNGETLMRRRLVLTANPCKVATCTMCPFPDEGLLASTPHTDEDILAQLTSSVTPQEDLAILTLYHNGNFFLESEISPQLREKILRYVATLKISRFCVESLPQTISPAKLIQCREILGPIVLEVAIGVQSMDPFLREHCIASPFSADQLDTAIALMREHAYEPRVFLMYGIPFLTPAEYLLDLLNALAELQSRYAILNPVICPLGVVPHTLVADLEAKNLWSGPSLTNVYQMLNQIPAVGPKVAVNCSAQNFIKELTPDHPLDHALDIFKAYNSGQELPFWLQGLPLIPPEQYSPANVFDQLKEYLTHA